MEANRITAPRPGWLRTVLDRLRPRAGRTGERRDAHAGVPLVCADGAPLVPRAAGAVQAAGLARASGDEAAGSSSDAASRAFEQTAAAVDFLVHVDRNLRFLYVSDASLRFAGYHREFLLGASLHDLVASDDLARLDALSSARSKKTRSIS